MPTLYRLIRNDGECTFLIETRDGARIVEHCRGYSNPLQFEYTTVAKALHVLGGMFAWERWTEDTRALLNHLNGGRGAI